MTIYKKLLTLVMVLWVGVAQAQWQPSDITRITYHSVFGGTFSSPFAILIEIKPDGTIKMYNDTYDSTLGKIPSAMVEEKKQNETSEEYLVKLLSDDPSYFAGRITNKEYKQLIDVIIHIQNDTSKTSERDTCDSSFKVLKVYSQNEKKVFLQCGNGTNQKIINLMNLLDEVAYKKGYKSTGKFDLNEIRH